MADVREAILARLPEIAQGIEGVKKVRRNATGLSSEQRPGVVVNDADEQAPDEDFDRGRPTTAPLRMDLTPEIWILLGDAPEDLGPSLSAFRSALVKAILNDAALLGLTTAIEYRGCQTTFRRGLDMDGTTRLNFVFTYVLKPDAL